MITGDIHGIAKMVIDHAVGGQDFLLIPPDRAIPLEKINGTGIGGFVIVAPTAAVITVILISRRYIVPASHVNVKIVGIALINAILIDLK